MKLQYDKKAADAPFEVGQCCWVYTPSSKKGLSKKLRHLWHGPFRICRKLSPVHYQLRTCDNRLVATTVHANRMKHFYDPTDRPIAPPQEMILINFLCREQISQPTVSNQKILKLLIPLQNRIMVNSLMVLLLIPQMCSKTLMSMLLKRFSSSKNGMEDTNTLSNGQISQSQKARGNRKKTILDRRLLENFHSNQS